MLPIRLVVRDGERIANPLNVPLLEYKPVDTGLIDLEKQSFPLYRLLQAI
jgi:hypothetical protein